MASKGGVKLQATIYSVYLALEKSPYANIKGDTRYKNSKDMILIASI